MCTLLQISIVKKGKQRAGREPGSCFGILHYCKFLGELLRQVSALGSPQNVNIVWKKGHTGEGFELCCGVEVNVRVDDGIICGFFCHTDELVRFEIWLALFYQM